MSLIHGLDNNGNKVPIKIFTSQLDSSSSQPTSQKSTSNAGWTLEQGQIGGERNPDSPTNNYDAVHEESNYSVVDLGVNSTTVCATPCFVYGWSVNTAIGTTTLIKDGTTTVFTIPTAAATAGSVFKCPAAIRFETSLVVDPDDAETVNNFVIFWRPI